MKLPCRIVFQWRNWLISSAGLSEQRSVDNCKVSKQFEHFRNFTPFTPFESRPQLISFKYLNGKWPFSEPACGKTKRSTHINYTSLENYTLRIYLADVSDKGVRLVFPWCLLAWLLVVFAISAQPGHHLNYRPDLQAHWPASTPLTHLVHITG